MRGELQRPKEGHFLDEEQVRPPLQVELEPYSALEINMDNLKRGYKIYPPGASDDEIEQAIYDLVHGKSVTWYPPK